jgi:hypothetical protein
VTKRFVVQKTLPNLWEVKDFVTMQTEFVLFGEYDCDHARMWVTCWEAMRDFRHLVLKRLAETATRRGIYHTFVPPKPPAPEQWILLPGTPVSAENVQ